jgi:hypothetical protein
MNYEGKVSGDRIRPPSPRPSPPREGESSPVAKLSDHPSGRMTHGSGERIPRIRNSRCEPLNRPMTGNHLECGGKWSATPLWLGTVNRVRKRCRRCALPPRSIGSHANRRFRGSCRFRLELLTDPEPQSERGIYAASRWTARSTCEVPKVARVEALKRRERRAPERRLAAGFGCTEIMQVGGRADHRES